MSQMGDDPPVNQRDAAADLHRLIDGHKITQAIHVADVVDTTSGVSVLVGVPA